MEVTGATIIARSARWRIRADFESPLPLSPSGPCGRVGATFTVTDLQRAEWGITEGVVRTTDELNNQDGKLGDGDLGSTVSPAAGSGGSGGACRRMSGGPSLRQKRSNGLVFVIWDDSRVRLIAVAERQWDGLNFLVGNTRSSRHRSRRDDDARQRRSRRQDSARFA